MHVHKIRDFKFGAFKRDGKKGYIYTTEAEISDFQSLDPTYSNMQL